MRVDVRFEGWLRIVLAAVLWVAVNTSPLRPPARGSVPPNFLRRNYAVCPSRQVKALAHFEAVPCSGLVMNRFRRGSGRDTPPSRRAHLWSRPRSAVAADPEGQDRLPCRIAPLLRC